MKEAGYNTFFSFDPGLLSFFHWLSEQHHSHVGVSGGYEVILCDLFGVAILIVPVFDQLILTF